MEKIEVLLGKNSYDIVIGHDILDKITDYTKKYDKILVISNDTIGKIYKDRFVTILQKESKDVYFYEIIDGEEYKKIDTVLPIYDYMIENNFDRSSLVISLGGGVVCDLTGYVAATFMRGLDFIQIPTSLLAQVDASVGGKVAVNHPKGKNLIGAFYQPKLVFIDTMTLSTLPAREIKTGLAEIIKHSIIWDREYYDYLYENSDKILNLDVETLIKTVKISCEIKANIVSQDETEKGVRKLLNYGHTYGHVIESLTAYSVYRHGEAVIFGMNFAAHLAKELGLVDDNFIKEQNDIFIKFGLEYEIPKYDYKIFTEILKHDKKVKKGKIVFVLPNSIGKADGYEVDEDIIQKVYNEIEGRDVKAVIDIGTNTMRMYIAEVKNGKIIHSYKKYMDITKIGTGVSETKLISNEAMIRNLETLKKYKMYGESYGVKEINIVATSAVRDAKNKTDFLDLVLKETGFKIEVISGIEEGTYTFRGVNLENIDGNILVIDIGGGSTEFIYGNKEEIKYIKSLNVGAARLKELFFADENYKDNYDRAKQFILDKFAELKFNYECDCTLVGVAGTITTQVTVTKEIEDYCREKTHMYRLTLEEIERNLDKFQSVGLEEREKIKGLLPKRADVIVSGTFLLKIILEYFNKKEIVVSENDILEGLMINI